MDENIEQNLNRSKKLRTALISSFSKILKSLREEFGKSDSNLEDCQGKLCKLENKLEELRSLDKTTLYYILDKEDNSDELENEIKNSDEYEEQFNQIRVYVQAKIDNVKFSPGNESVCSRASSKTKTRFKLPSIEFNKFSGDLKGWLVFCGQFKRIDDDETIDDIDKYQYLIQATVPHSKARKIVESYPPIGENYKKAITSLKVYPLEVHDNDTILHPKNLSLQRENPENQKLKEVLETVNTMSGRHIKRPSRFDKLYGPFIVPWFVPFHVPRWEDVI